MITEDEGLIHRHKNAIYLEQTRLENLYLFKTEKYRKAFQIPLEIIGAYYLSKNGIATNNVTECIAGGLIGLTLGWTSGAILGTLVYETFNPAGHINKFFSRKK